MAVMSGSIANVIARAGHSVDVQRPLVSEDDLGGRNRIWNTVASGLACWVQPAGSSTIEAYAKRGIIITHRMHFAATPGIRVGDRLKFGARLMVVEGIRNVAETGELWYADCREMD